MPEEPTVEASTMEPTPDAHGRIPPQDIEAECSVLGAMMLAEDAIAEAMTLLAPEDFYLPAHRKIFECMIALYERNEPIDEVTIAAHLRHTGEIEKIGGAQKLAWLTASVPTAANLIYYARIVHQRALTRRLIEAATHIAGLGYHDHSDIDSLLDLAEAKIFEITSSREKQNFVPLKEAIKHAIQQVEKSYDSKTVLTGLPTGFSDLDHKTSGLQASDLIIVAGRPSMGKTAFALGIAQNAAILHKQPVALFSLEMSKEQLVMRMLCAESRIDSQRLRRGMLRDYEWTQLITAASYLAEAAVYLDDTGSISILEMRAKCRRLKAEHGLGLIVVDYLQLMRGRTSAKDSREREISDISRGLKALAKELNVPVVALSQLNRSVEARQDKRPGLSDLRESGAIEQDADLIMMVYRDEYYHPDSPDKGLAEIIIVKQRNGPTGTIQLKFTREHTRFDDLPAALKSEGENHEPALDRDDTNV